MWSDFGFDISDSDGTREMHLHGELDLANAEKTQHALSQLCGPSVCLNLCELRFLDARGLGAIVVARNALLAKGYAFKIVGAHGIVRRVFDLSGLSDILDD